MRRFRWSLQRYLDVTNQRELALRSELVEASSRISRKGEDIVRRRGSLHNALYDLSGKAVAERLAGQELFMRCVAAAEREIAKLNEELAELREHRRRKTEELAAVKSSRKMLERLREKARHDWWRSYQRWQQRQTDESANLACARKRLAARASGRARSRP